MRFSKRFVKKYFYRRKPVEFDYVNDEMMNQIQPGDKSIGIRVGKVKEIAYNRVDKFRIKRSH